MKKLFFIQLLSIILIAASCSKNQSAQHDDARTYARNVAQTWVVSLNDISTSPDTATVQPNGNRWVQDIVVLTNDEARKLQTLIEGVPQPVLEAYISKSKTLIDKLKTPEMMLSSIHISYMNVKEWDDFRDFCITNRSAILPLCFGAIFNNKDEYISLAGRMGLDLQATNYENLKNEVEAEIRANEYTASGAIISYSPVSRARRLAKKILATM